MGFFFFFNWKKFTTEINGITCLKIICLHLMMLSRSAEYVFTLYSGSHWGICQKQVFQEKSVIGCVAWRLLTQRWQLSPRNQSSLLASFGEQGERTKGCGCPHVPAVARDGWQNLAMSKEASQPRENKICCEAVSYTEPQWYKGCWGDVCWVEANCNICSNIFPFELVHIINFVVV